MRQLAILILTLAVLGYAEAGGRAACRLVYGPPLWSVCYAEQIVWSAGPLEAALGLEARTWPEMSVAPYLLIGWYEATWWATVELARSPWSWRWALGTGFRW